MLLNEIILTKPIFEEVQREKLLDGVLCRVTYNVNNIGERNANKRVYEKAVWDKVLADNDLKKKLESRALFGHAEHPEQTQSNLEKTSHVIFEMWIDEKENQVYQKIDVLDTPTGRIVDTLLRAGCQVGVSTRAEGDLEEAEDDSGVYQRVVPESYRYVTTDFTADPSTFGVVPQDVKRNIVSTVGKELSNEKADKSEKEFARLLLESMKCGKKDDCQKCGRCKVLGESPVKNMSEAKKTVKDLITDSTIKVGTKIKYGDQDAEVEKIEEGAVNLTVSTGTSATNVQIFGDNHVSINPAGVIVIVPETAVKPLVIPEAPKPELPPEEEIDKMAAAGPLPIEDEIPEEEKEVEERKEVDEGFRADLKNKDKKAVQQKIEAITDKLFAGEKLSSSELTYWDAYHAEVSKIREKEKAVKKAHQTKESKLAEVLDIEYNSTLPIIESVENVSYVTVGRMIGRPCIFVKFSKIRETLQGILVDSEEEAIDKGKKIADSLEVEFRMPPKFESKKLDEVSRLLVKVHFEDGTRDQLVDARKVLGEGYLCGIEEKSVESISTTAKEIVDLKVQEASTRAERDKALELLEELTSENQVTNKDKALEAKMLVSRIRKILEAKEQEVDALRTKLGEKAKLASELKEKGTELKEELDKVKINLVTDIRELEKEAIGAAEYHRGLTQAENKVKELERELDSAKKECEKIKGELDKLTTKYSESIEQLKTEFNTKISEGVEKAKKEVVSGFVKRFVALRLTESELKIDDNSRALLENCKSLEDVDDTFDEILDASRRGALHSNLLESITVNKPVVDPEQREAERQVNNVFEGMGFITKG